MNIAKYIDHTLLKATATKKQVKELCEEAVRHDFYAVCVNGCYVAYATQLLKASPVKVAAVVGFPLGAMDVESKIFEAKKCVEHGADEIDMVLNISLLKSGCYMQVADEIRWIKEAIGNKVLKVILETCYLTTEEIIVASQMVVSGKADFVKTSTGFGIEGAKFEDVVLMKEVVGQLAEVKASGGIRDDETATKFVEAGAMRLGTSSGISIVTQKQTKDEHTY
jgi:deoxyribose-phosphate aldolase